MQIRGIEVHHYDQGTGDAILFLHGWGSSFSLFLPFMESLSAYRRVCALDFPGFGSTEEPPTGWYVDDFADFVVEFVRKLGITSLTLVGHSFGGRVIIKLANRKNLPFTIQRIVLTGSAGIKPKATPRQKIRARVYKMGSWLFNAPLIRRMNPDLIENWRRSHGSADYRNATPRMRDCLVKVLGEDLTPLLPGISCPTLLVWGENDQDTPLSDGRLMERLIPDAGLVALKGAGHYAFVEQGYAFGRILDSFLGIERQVER